MKVEISDREMVRVFRDYVHQLQQDEVDRLFTELLGNLDTNRVNQVQVVRKMIEWSSERWAIPLGFYLPASVKKRKHPAK